MNAPESPIRVFIVDNAARIRAGLRMRLTAEPDLVVVGDDAVNSQILSKVVQSRSQVVLLGAANVRDGVLKPIDLLPRLATVSVVIAICMPHQEALMVPLLAAGATAVQFAGDAGAELPDVIRRVAGSSAGGRWVTMASQMARPPA